jgi:UDP-glucose 4-epimerase
MVRKGLPLPFGLVRNKRSMVHVHNLTGAILHLLSGQDREGPFLIRDGRDLSTAELVRLMGLGLGRPARLLPVPPALLRVAGVAAGKKSMVDRLLGDLRLDDSRLRETGWTPKIDAERGIIETAARHKQARGNS